MTARAELDALVSRIRPPDDRAANAARERWAGRAMPPGALGRLQDLAVQVAGVTGRCPPDPIRSPAVIVFAGDHGVAADGASAWPSEVTGLMVRAMAAGGAAINALAASAGADVTVVDVGVASDLGDLRGVVGARVRPGTASIARGPAMSSDDAVQAVLAGARIAADRIEAGADLLVGGDMGIGNTTPSSALVAALTGHPDPPALVGRGAGLDDDSLDHKRRIVAAAVDRSAGLDDPIEILAALGGLEIGALAGLHLAAAAARVPVVVDGVIGCAALCVAHALAPDVSRLVIAGHRSVEPAASHALGHLGLEPVLDLDLRLGEGTGACLAVPLVAASVAALGSMADLPA